MGGLPSKIKSVVHTTTDLIERIPKRVKTYILVIGGGAALVPLIFCLVGFTPVIAKGSLAAAWHSSIGNAVAGSLFSILQSLGAKPLLLVGIGALIGAVGCVIHSILEIFWDKDQDGEPPAYFEK